jgi:predicted nucleic acid-binding protein
VVVDASVALAWAFDGEASDYSDAVLSAVGAEGMRVPILFHLEIGNALSIALARGRITDAGASAFTGDLGRLRIQVDPLTAEMALGATLHYARRYRLSVYDAAYLELALREGLPLATQDAALVTVAKTLGMFYQP